MSQSSLWQCQIHQCSHRQLSLKCPNCHQQCEKAHFSMEICNIQVHDSLTSNRMIDKMIPFLKLLRKFINFQNGCASPKRYLYSTFWRYLSSWFLSNFSTPSHLSLNPVQSLSRLKQATLENIITNVRRQIVHCHSKLSMVIKSVHCFGG